MSHDLELAFSDAKDAIKLNEKDGDAYIIRGRVYSLMGNHDNAIADFNKAYEFAITRKEEIYLYRGIEYYITEKYDEAVRDLRKALKLKPKYAQALFYLGNVHYSKEEYKRAIDDYTQAIKLNPKDVMVLNNCGCAYVNILDYDRAMKIYNKLLKIEPYYPQAIRNRGLLHYDMGNYDQAIANYNISFEAKMNFYKKLLKGRDKEEDETEDFDSKEYKNWELEENQIDASVLFKRGNAFAHKRDLDHAIDDYTQAVEMNSDNDLLIQILCNRANVYSLKNDFIRAIDDYTKALEIKPNKPNKAYKTWILNNRGAAYYAIGDYNQAIADYKKAVEIDPEDGVARTNLFHAEEEAAKKIQGKKMEGKVNTIVYSKELDTIGEFSQIIKKNPNDFGAYVNRGGGYYIKQIFDKATDDYIKALSVLGLEYGTADIDKTYALIEKYNMTCKPNELVTVESVTDLYNFIGLAFRGMNNNDRALFNYNMAIAIDPGNFRAYNNFGFLYLNEGKNEEAVEYFNKAIAHNGKYAEAFSNRGIARNRMGQFKVAEDDYLAATKYDDKFADPWYNLGILYTESLRYKEAVVAFKRAVKINKKFALAYFNLGATYSKLEKYFRANYYVRKAYRLEPNNILIKNALSGK
jgi:tetratricopeptide (TPR) repeat protein